MLDNKQIIIFDFDGTLVDTMHIFADVASYLISENYGMSKEDAREKYFKTSGLPFIKQLEQIFPNNELNSKIVSLYETEKIDATSDIILEEDILETLERLKEHGYDIIVSSNNNQQNIDNFIINNNVDDIFTLRLGYRDNFSKGKDHFDFIINHLGIEKELLLFIGDSLNDAKIAKENNIDFVGITGTFVKKDFINFDKNIKVINSISDLIKI